MEVQGFYNSIHSWSVHIPRYSWSDTFYHSPDSPCLSVHYIHDALSVMGPVFIPPRCTTIPPAYRLQRRFSPLWKYSLLEEEERPIRSFIDDDIVDAISSLIRYSILQYF